MDAIENVGAMAVEVVADMTVVAIVEIGNAILNYICSNPNFQNTNTNTPNQVCSPYKFIPIYPFLEMAEDVQYGLTNTDLQREPIIESLWKICRAGSAGR